MAEFLRLRKPEVVEDYDIFHLTGDLVGLHAVERHWRDARLTKIFEGTSEIQKRIISDRLLGRGRN